MRYHWLAPIALFLFAAVACDRTPADQVSGQRYFGPIKVDEDNDVAAIRAGEGDFHAGHPVIIFRPQFGMDGAQRIVKEGYAIIDYTWVQDESGVSLLMLAGNTSRDDIQLELSRVELDGTTISDITNVNPSGWPEDPVLLGSLTSNHHDRKIAFLVKRNSIDGEAIGLMIAHDGGQHWEHIVTPDSTDVLHAIWIDEATLGVLLVDGRMAQLIVDNGRYEWSIVADSVHNLYWST